MVQDASFLKRKQNPTRGAMGDRSGQQPGTKALGTLGKAREVAFPKYGALLVQRPAGASTIGVFGGAGMLTILAFHAS
ncbi:hypothetical protein AK812_SmicGene4117 [Symbiodinium microadriaticum]|uniref:Uncharacterized protein n=1 Tax=Symbiodinium microadriaticum TaxID=2951 RepID=A0A1Q9EX20_SYMMI|nr:hypothetical protein AK812_SmicGene4117 [Symbiodinium microadriaticum]